MEEVSKKVPRKERMAMLVRELEKGSNKDDPKKYNLSPLMSYISEMMKISYIAGANRTNKEIIDTGEILVGATNFTKDKGFSI